MMRNKAGVILNIPSLIFHISSADCQEHPVVSNTFMSEAISGPFLDNVPDEAAMSKKAAKYQGVYEWFCISNYDQGVQPFNLVCS